MYLGGGIGYFAVLAKTIRIAITYSAVAKALCSIAFFIIAPRLLRTPIVTSYAVTLRSLSYAS